uniref:Uncharacterized protein n=1 Tax=Gibberella zeae (strain ATCC MYA-4620 / CBS 123657 / FGSC 9075 / NRRL 31084 / PH-1) TaxID=229533 RepID=A0A098DZF6_GIBZE
VYKQLSTSTYADGDDPLGNLLVKKLRRHSTYNKRSDERRDAMNKELVRSNLVEQTNKHPQKARPKYTTSTETITMQWKRHFTIAIVNLFNLSLE